MFGGPPYYEVGVMTDLLPDIPGLPLPLSGETRLFVIIGDPIAQVGSPGLFNPAFRRRGAKAVLVPVQVAPSDLPAAMNGFRRLQNLDGIVVTVPHKIAVMDLIDEVRPSGRRIGAVNAIRRMADGSLVGDNFDGKGCVRGLVDEGHSLAGKSILIVGGGGAGRAVAHAMSDEGPARLRLFEVDRVRLEQLIASLRDAHPELVVETGPPDPEGFDVVVNCTPLGMQAGDPYPVDPFRIDPATLVVDVILKPATSPLIQAAAQRGCAVQKGIRMLEGQVEAICDFFAIGSEP
jgi:shikimate dehydrogenase